MSGWLQSKSPAPALGMLPDEALVVPTGTRNTSLMFDGISEALVQ
jgi:hypothetical protein